MRLLCEDAARACWLVLRGAAAELAPSCASLPARCLSRLLLEEAHLLRVAPSSLFSACGAIDEWCENTQTYPGMPTLAGEEILL